MTELTPSRFGIGPPPQPKPPQSQPQSMGQPGMGQSGMATTPGASVTMSGNTPTEATIGNTGAGSAAPMHPTAVSAPSVNPSPAANGAVPGATAGPVQRPGVSGMNGYAANTMPGVFGTPTSGAATAPTAPALAQTAASALATSTNTTVPLSMPAPYIPTIPQTTNPPISVPTENASPAPIRGGRGVALSEEDKVLLLKICIESQNTLKFSTKTAFWRRVSNRFETIRGGRQYSAMACERAVTKWTDARRAALKNAGERRVLSEAQKFTLLVDQMVTVQDEAGQKAKEKEAELREMFEKMEGGYYGTSTQTPARTTGNRQDETQVSASIFDHNTLHGSKNSNATTPEIDITDSNITTLTTTHTNNPHNNDDDPVDFEATVISELSRIRSLVTHEATVSVATTNFLKKNQQSLNAQLDRLEDKLKEMQKTLDQQTGILSDQNTVLKQILTMMSHGRRSPMTPGPPYQGPPYQGPPPPHGAPYYPPYPGPPYYPYYQGTPFQRPPPQGFPPQGPPPQGFPPRGPPLQGPQSQAQPPKTSPQAPQSQGAQPQAHSQGAQSQNTQTQGSQTPGPKPEAAQPQPPPAQGTQPQGPPPPPGKFAIFSGWVS